MSLLTQATEQRAASERVYFETLCRLFLGEAHLLAGRLEEAEALAERALALALAKALGMRPLVSHCHLGLGKLCVTIGRLTKPTHSPSAAWSALADGRVF